MRVQVVVTDNEAADLQTLSEKTGTPVSSLIKNVLYEKGILKKITKDKRAYCYKKDDSVLHNRCAWCGEKNEGLSLHIHEETKSIVSYCRDCYTKNKS